MNALAARSTFARSAHGGQILASVAPHGTITETVSPVAASVRRSCTGRRHPPDASAIFRIESRASGEVARSARVWRPVMSERLLPCNPPGTSWAQPTGRASLICAWVSVACAGAAAVRTTQPAGLQLLRQL